MCGRNLCCVDDVARPVMINSKPAGRVEFELFSDVTPKCAENFRALCTGEKGKSASGHNLHFSGSKVDV